MNDSVRYFLTDLRAYEAVGVGVIGVVLCSRRVLTTWPFRGRVKPEHATLFWAVLLLMFAIFFGPIAFDWSGEFAAGILCAFGLALSIQLLRFRGWLFRGLGLLLVLVYGHAIYGTVAAWIARAHSGHPFR